MNASEYKLKGNQFLQNGEFDAAIDAYTRAIEIDPTDHIFFSNRSAAYLSKGDANRALEDGNKVIALNPQFAKGYSRKGAALHALKRYDEAKSAFEDGLKIAPSDSGLLNGLNEVTRAQTAPPAGGFGLLSQQLLSKIATHPKFGPRLADPVFMAKLQMLNTNPQAILQDPEMMEILGLLIGSDPSERSTPQSSQNFSQENPKPTKSEPKENDEDLTDDERALKRSKILSQELKEQGNAFYKSKKFSEALEAYDQAIIHDPTNMLLINNKAAVYIELGEFDKAIEECEKSVEVGRTHRANYEDVAKVYQRQATAWLKKNDIRSAIASYQKAQMEFSDKAVERKIKNLELELKNKERQEYINPELALEAKERGNTAFRESNFAVAISEYEEAIKRDPSNASYRNNLAATLLKIGDFNGAKANVDKSLELDKKYVKAWAKKGDIEFFMKEYHKALDSYKMGLQLEPENSLCKQGLQKTIQQINLASSQGPDSERAAHAMADPEIQAILMDPMIRQILNDMQENPSSAQRALNDPTVRAKIDKLIAAGVLQVK